MKHPMRLVFDEEEMDEIELSQVPLLKSGKLKVCKDSDDVVPLPNPFPLRKHYPYNVEYALH